MNHRRTQVKANDGWNDIEFMMLEDKDIFRLFESDGEAVIWEDTDEFIVEDKPFLTEQGIWTVKCNPYYN